MRLHNAVRAAAGLAIGIVLAGCSSSGSTAGSSQTSGRPAVPTLGASTVTSPNRPSPSSPVVEVHPPGDIPDNQAFVPYAGAGYRVTVPEGWARSTSNGAVEFTDKYNRITISTVATSTAPTVHTAATTEMAALKRASHGFVAGTVSSVIRSAGRAVLITYRALSPVNPVTGKVANEAVQRYEFWRSGHEVAITLAAPVGSDNVDPWRTITESFAWTRK